MGPLGVASSAQRRVREDSFHTGGITVGSTATALQLEGCGVSVARLGEVRLYHDLPEAVTWDETPPTQPLSANSTTLSGQLTASREYALGVIEVAVPTVVVTKG